MSKCYEYKSTPMEILPHPCCALLLFPSCHFYPSGFARLFPPKSYVYSIWSLFPCYMYVVWTEYFLRYKFWYIVSYVEPWPFWRPMCFFFLQRKDPTRKRFMCLCHQMGYNDHKCPLSCKYHTMKTGNYWHKYLQTV